MTEVLKATSTCCGKNTGGQCICASQATCSCGKQSALHCTCEKASLENVLSGPRCSCRARPAGQCTCENSGRENAPLGLSSGVAACACGARPADSCTCERSSAGTGGDNNGENEIDFTTRK